MDIEKCCVCGVHTAPFGIKRVYPGQKEALPEKGGVYFIFNPNNCLVYIGQSNNLLRRISVHASKNKSRDSYVPVGEVSEVCWIIEDEKHKRNFLEALYIFHFQPVYNCTKFQKAYYEHPELRHNIDNNWEHMTGEEMREYAKHMPKVDW